MFLVFALQNFRFSSLKMLLALMMPVSSLGRTKRIEMPRTACTALTVIVVLSASPLLLYDQLDADGSLSESVLIFPFGEIKSASAQIDLPFITTWETTSANQEIKFIMFVVSGGTAIIDWGDGTTETVTGNGGPQTHRYSTVGTHTVAISGALGGIAFPHCCDLPFSVTPERLKSIDQWGDIQWSTMAEAFLGAKNMEYKATDAPDLSRVTSMNRMFTNADAFNGDISGWDVSGVTDMGRMFYNADAFNGDISGWDVSGVTDTSAMFANAAFNGDISGWDVSGVTDTSAMFANAAFNGDISGWDVSSVTRMSGMFDASAFNGDISGWDVSSVTDKDYIFGHSYINDLITTSVIVGTVFGGGGGGAFLIWRRLGKSAATRRG